MCWSGNMSCNAGDLTTPDHTGFACCYCRCHSQLVSDVTSMTSRYYRWFSSINCKNLEFLPRCIVCNAVFLIAMPSVCLSVRRPSVTRVYCDETNESSADILTPYERKIHLLFRTRRMVGRGRPLLPEILGQTDQPSFKNGNFQPIFARSGSTLGPSKKRVNYR